MKQASIYPVNKRLWKCDGCGRVDQWGVTWKWYGSLLTQEEGIAPVVSCSPKCDRSDGVEAAKIRQGKAAKAAMRRIRL